MKKIKSFCLKVMRFIMRNRLLIVIGCLFYAIVRYNKEFSLKVYYSHYTSNQKLIAALPAIFGFMIILIAIVFLDSFLITRKKNNFKKVFCMELAITSFTLEIVLMTYNVVPVFFKNYTEVVQIKKQLPDEVVIIPNDSPTFPFKAEKGQQAVIFDINSNEMKSFIEDLYNENKSFFIKEDRDIFIYENDKMYKKDDKEMYTGDIIEAIKSLNYSTIWVFSNAFQNVSQNTQVSQKEAMIIIYSTEMIDIDNLKTHFSANGITVKNIK